VEDQPDPCLQKIARPVGSRRQPPLTCTARRLTLIFPGLRRLAWLYRWLYADLARVRPNMDDNLVRSLPLEWPASGGCLDGWFWMEWD
jgi:hypothetical protein